MSEYNVRKIGIFLAVRFIECGEVFKSVVPHIAVGITASVRIGLSVSAVVVGDDDEPARGHKFRESRIAIAAFRHAVRNLHYSFGFFGKPFAISNRLAVVRRKSQFVHIRHLSILFFHSL